MEFHHAPKLWHGWREFLREYLIVVVGVLTAAAVGLSLDWLRIRVEVADAREALRTEIARNALIASINVEEERCYVGLLDRGVAWINGGPPLHVTIKGGLRSQVTSTWDVVKVGAAAYMPLRERLAYSSFYDDVDALKYLIERERDATLRLTGIFSRAATAAPTDKQRALEDIAQWRLLGALHGGGSADIIRQAKAMGVRPEPMPLGIRQSLADLCAQAGMAPPPTS